MHSQTWCLRHHALRHGSANYEVTFTERFTAGACVATFFSGYVAQLFGATCETETRYYYS